jgi:hypothetical protein
MLPRRKGPYETGGAVNVDYSPTGLKYALRAPLPPRFSRTVKGPGELTRRLANWREAFRVPQLPTALSDLLGASKNPSCGGQAGVIDCILGDRDACGANVFAGGRGRRLASTTCRIFDSSLEIGRKWNIEYELQGLSSGLLHLKTVAHDKTGAVSLGIWRWSNGRCASRQAPAPTGRLRHPRQTHFLSLVQSSAQRPSRSEPAKSRTVPFLSSWLSCCPIELGRWMTGNKADW